MDISKTEKVRCPRCFKTSNLGEWDDLTFKQCFTREMKRAYTKLTLKKAFKRESNTFYMCPKCKAWSRGCNLTITDTDDNELKRLGGESIYG
jgi:DNA-directed RNA polymerase subunit RPC12/RpoP